MKDKYMNSKLAINDPAAFGKSLPMPRARFDSKGGAILVDGEEQPAGRGGLQAFLLASDTAIAIAEWSKNDTGDPVLDFDDDPRLLRNGAEFPYPLPEGKCPYHEMPMIIEGIGLVKFSGTSWASWNAIKRACANYWSNGCSVFALCWADIVPLVKSKHKNFGLTFRPIEWVAVERFAQFAPGAVAMKEAISPSPTTPPLGEGPAKLSASGIVNDSVDDVSTPENPPLGAAIVRPTAAEIIDDAIPF
jgi:hypothetical protein